MRRLIATFIKDIKLLIGDRTGIAILFVMPVLLVFIMTLTEHEAYKSLSQSGIPVLLVNRDADSLGYAVETGFRKFPLAQLTIDHGEKYPSDTEIKKDIVKGKFTIALVIPPFATKALEGNAEEIMGKMFKQEGVIGSKVNIEVIIDPTANKPIVIAITSRLREFLASVKTNILFQIMADKISKLMNSDTKPDMPKEDFFSYQESYAFRDLRKNYQPNEVQHNVPAWGIFSIFFIVIPLAGGVINERSEGLFIRMRTLPGSYLLILSGKLLTYFFVAIIQFMLLLFMGIYLLPLIGLPALDIGPHLFPLIILTIVLAMAAIGYGLLVGTLFDTLQQSAVFGGISILIMSALGGIWVPMNIMPEMMQKVSTCSPLNWALVGYYELFIKGGDWAAIQIQVFRLFIFFIVCLALAYRLFKVKTRFN